MKKPFPLRWKLFFALLAFGIIPFLLVELTFYKTLFDALESARAGEIMASVTVVFVLLYIFIIVSAFFMSRGLTIDYEKLKTNVEGVKAGSTRLKTRLKPASDLYEVNELLQKLLVELNESDKIIDTVIDETAHVVDEIAKEPEVRGRHSEAAESTEGGGDEETTATPAAPAEPFPVTAAMVNGWLKEVEHIFERIARKSQLITDEGLLILFNQLNGQLDRMRMKVEFLQAWGEADTIDADSFEKIEMKDVFRAVKGKYADALGERCEVAAPGKWPKITSNRHAIEKIWDVFFGGAVSHVADGAEHTIRVTYRKDEKMHLFEITDDGPAVYDTLSLEDEAIAGMVKDARQGDKTLFDMRLVRKWMDRLGGSFTLGVSHPDGNTVKFGLPVQGT